MAVEKGNTIKVEYTGSFENGEVFDASEKHGQPLEFKAGEGMVVPGFDNAVIGMELNEEKTVTLQPEDAYGMPNPEAIQKIPKENFPAEAKEGMMIGVPMPNGQQIPATITKITDTEVTIDMNPPMAGKVLVFKIKVVSIE
jgi:FKBP-type peptidyl-prolyl cis-trans isomerase 2